MRKSIIFCLCLLFMSGSPARAEFYRWVDKDGKEFFTNERTKIPREYRDHAAAVPTDSARVSIGEKAGGPGKPPAGAREHKDRFGRGEEYWRKRADKLRKELAALETRHDQLVQREKSEIGNSGGRSSKKGKKGKSLSGQESGRSKLERELAAKKHELDVELPDEARKADAYPGWIR